MCLPLSPICGIAAASPTVATLPWRLLSKHIVIIINDDDRSNHQKGASAVCVVAQLNFKICLDFCLTKCSSPERRLIPGRVKITGKLYAEGEKRRISQPVDTCPVSDSKLNVQQRMKRKWRASTEDVTHQLDQMEDGGSTKRWKIIHLIENFILLKTYSYSSRSRPKSQL